MLINKRQYKGVSSIFSEKYEAKYFGDKLNKDSVGLSQDDINSVKTGYKRVTEKIKERRHAITTRTRNGPGKLVLEFYDNLIQVWGGSSSTKSLTFGVRSVDNSDNPEEQAVVNEPKELDKAAVS